MGKKCGIFFIMMICFVLVVYGTICVNSNFYSVIAKDGSMDKVAETLNKDNAPLKIFKDMDESSELYPLIDNAKNKSILVFYKTNPLNISIEGQQYCMYINDTVDLEYRNNLIKMSNLARNEYNSMMERVKQGIMKITAKDTSY